MNRDAGSLIFHLSEHFLVAHIEKWMVLWVVTEVKHMAVFLHILVDVFTLDVVHERVCICKAQLRIISILLLDVSIVEVVHQ